MINRKLYLYNLLICIYVLLRVKRAGRGITSRLALVHKQPGLELLSVLKRENQKDSKQEFPMRPPSLSFALDPVSLGHSRATL